MVGNLICDDLLDFLGWANGSELWRRHAVMFTLTLCRSDRTAIEGGQVYLRDRTANEGRQVIHVHGTALPMRARDRSAVA